jgi:hypothetical protein
MDPRMPQLYSMHPSTLSTLQRGEVGLAPTLHLVSPAPLLCHQSGPSFQLNGTCGSVVTTALSLRISVYQAPVNAQHPNLVHTRGMWHTLDERSRLLLRTRENRG